MPRLYDRVKETTTSTGTGDITLAGAATRYVTFSSVFTIGAEQVPYCIEAQSGSEWEVGMGVYSASNTLTRDRVLASSNSGSLVNFSAGTKDVFLTAHSEVVNTNARALAVTRGYAIF